MKKFCVTLQVVIRDPRQSSLLILSEFERGNLLRFCIFDFCIFEFLIIFKTDAFNFPVYFLKNCENRKLFPDQIHDFNKILVLRFLSAYCQLETSAFVLWGSNVTN